MESIEELLNETKKDGRICPQPQVWVALCEVMQGAACDGAGRPPSPLILAAWHEPHLSKIIRFQEQMHWADQSGCLPQVAEFIKNMSEENWFRGD
jgi:hypothetical protein